MHLAFPPSAAPGHDDAAGARPDPLDTARRLAEHLAASAIERDRSGGHGADWPTVYQAARIVARADSAPAHLLGFHHLQLAGIHLYGSAQQQRRLDCECHGSRFAPDGAVLEGPALVPLAAAAVEGGG